MDVIISNCVVNLSPDKPTVLHEAFRVLRPGGRLAISDIVVRHELPTEVAMIMGLWTGCVAGALPETVLRDHLDAAGFTDVEIEPTNVFGRRDLTDMAGSIDPAALPTGVDVDRVIAELDGVIMSAFIRARKPG